MFKLIDLPYALDALEPVLSAQTLAFHHGKHLQTYVDNLNKLIVGTAFEDKSLEDIVVISSGAASSVTSSTIERSIFNNAGQVLNHNLYFTQFAPILYAVFESPHAELDLASPLAKQITKQWGSIDAFKTEFEAKSVGLFGSGWVWLQADGKCNLSIAQYSGADNPVAHDVKPLLTFDVWEHAYYLDYQNRRAAYLKELWRIVDWSIIENRYTD